MDFQLLPAALEQFYGEPVMRYGNEILFVNRV